MFLDFNKHDAWKQVWRKLKGDVCNSTDKCVVNYQLALIIIFELVHLVFPRALDKLFCAIIEFLN